LTLEKYHKIFDRTLKNRTSWACRLKAVDRLVARVERSDYPGTPVAAKALPDFATLNPGYEAAPANAIRGNRKSS